MSNARMGSLLIKHIKHYILYNILTHTSLVKHLFAALCKPALLIAVNSMQSNSIRLNSIQFSSIQYNSVQFNLITFIVLGKCLSGETGAHAATASQSARCSCNNPPNTVAATPVCLRSCRSSFLACATTPGHHSHSECHRRLAAARRVTELHVSAWVHVTCCKQVHVVLDHVQAH